MKSLLNLGDLLTTSAADLNSLECWKGSCFVPARVGLRIFQARAPFVKILVKVLVVGDRFCDITKLGQIVVE